MFKPDGSVFLERGRTPYNVAFKEPLSQKDMNSVIAFARLAEQYSCDIHYFQQNVATYFLEANKKVEDAEATELFNKLLKESLSVKLLDNDCRVGDDEHAWFYEDVIVWVIDHFTFNLEGSCDNGADQTYGIKPNSDFKTFLEKIDFTRAYSKLCDKLLSARQSGPYDKPEIANPFKLSSEQSNPSTPKQKEPKGHSPQAQSSGETDSQEEKKDKGSTSSSSESARKTEGPRKSRANGGAPTSSTKGGSFQPHSTARKSWSGNFPHRPTNENNGRQWVPPKGAFQPGGQEAKSGGARPTSSKEKKSSSQKAGPFPNQHEYYRDQPNSPKGKEEKSGASGSGSHSSGFFDEQARRHKQERKESFAEKKRTTTSADKTPEKEFIPPEKMTTSIALSLVGTISRNDWDRIKSAYKKQALNNHPDKGGDEEEFKQLSVAYEFLRGRHARMEQSKQGQQHYKGNKR